MERAALVPSTFALPKRFAYIPTRIVVIAVSLLEVLLGLRFVLKLAGANADAPFVWLLYVLTKPFLLLFDGAFAPAVVEKGYVLETSTLLAMAVYAIAAWFALQFMAIVAERRQGLKEHGVV